MECIRHPVMKKKYFKQPNLHEYDILTVKLKVVELLRLTVILPTYLCLNLILNQ